MQPSPCYIANACISASLCQWSWSFYFYGTKLQGMGISYPMGPWPRCGDRTTQLPISARTLSHCTFWSSRLCLDAARPGHQVLTCLVSWLIRMLGSCNAGDARQQSTQTLEVSSDKRRCRTGLASSFSRPCNRSRHEYSKESNVPDVCHAVSSHLAVNPIWLNKVAVPRLPKSWKL